MSPQSKGAPHLGLRWHDAALVVMSVNSVTFAARSFRPRQGARCFRTGTRAYPTRICKERATQPGPKRPAARRVAPNLAWGFVARRSQPHCRGMLPGARAEAHRASPPAKLGATNVTEFTLLTTKST